MTCKDCNHDFHRAGDCDHCNCGESEMIRSKQYDAYQFWVPSDNSKQLLPAN